MTLVYTKVRAGKKVGKSGCWIASKKVKIQITKPSRLTMVWKFSHN